MQQTSLSTKPWKPKITSTPKDELDVAIYKARKAGMMYKTICFFFKRGRGEIGHCLTRVEKAYGVTIIKRRKSK